MSLIGSVSGFFQQQTPAALEIGKLGKAAQIEMPELGGATALQAPQQASSSFGSILDSFVNEVDTKMEAGSAQQAQILSGESSNLHQAMISMQEASVAFSLMVEVRNKMVESYQELMRMQV
jgi:flagellar hook-basal body complex protein FliE